MKKKLQHFKTYATLYLSSTLLTSTFMPTAFAASNGPQAPEKILRIISSLLNIFKNAGFLLLAYSVFSLILAVKNEDAESKVTASSQMAVSLVCITLSSLINKLFEALGVTQTV